MQSLQGTLGFIAPLLNCCHEIAYFALVNSLQSGNTILYRGIEVLIVTHAPRSGEVGLSSQDENAYKICILKLYIWLKAWDSTCTLQHTRDEAGAYVAVAFAAAASLNRHHYLRWRRICGICSELLSLLLRLLRRRRLREEEPSPVLVLESWMQGGIPTVLAFSSKIVNF